MPAPALRASSRQADLLPEAHRIPYGKRQHSNGNDDDQDELWQLSHSTRSSSLSSQRPLARLCALSGYWIEEMRLKHAAPILFIVGNLVAAQAFAGDVSPYP